MDILKNEKYELLALWNTQLDGNRSKNENEKVEIWKIPVDSMLEIDLGLSQIPRGSFQKWKNEKYELSAFQNIKNYQNPPNSDGERCIWNLLPIAADFFTDSRSV